jgi:ribosome-binding factor A
MTVPGRRPERLQEQIRQEISVLLVSGLRDPRIGFSTITDVRVTPDLRHARVLVSVLGNPEEQQKTLQGFRAAAAYIRRELAHRIDVRRMPELEFRLDTSAERAARIDELLRQAHSAEEGEENK